MSPRRGAGAPIQPLFAHGARRLIVRIRIGRATGAFVELFCDGSVKFIKETISPATR